MASEKLQKILARAGLGSRRQLEVWIAEGRVVVNGDVAKLGDRATADDKIKVDGKLLKIEKAEARVILLNKPEGVICTRNDEHDRPMVFDLLPPLDAGRWVGIGRLDLNTSGLLLFTDDGDLANQLMHPSKQIEREYLVRVLGEVPDASLTAMLTSIELEDGPAHFSDIIGPRGRGVNQWFNVVLKEGRNREVRRLWESQGVKVSRLKRIRFGQLSLPRTLKEGSFLELNRSQIRRLQR